MRARSVAVAASPGWGGEQVELWRVQSDAYAAVLARLDGKRTWRQLPTLRELAAALGVNVGTVSRTLRRLAELGLVDRQALRGRLGLVRVRLTRRSWRSRPRRALPRRPVPFGQLALAYSDAVTATPAREPGALDAYGEELARSIARRLGVSWP